MPLGRWLPVVGWAAFIFLFSTSTFGGEHTGSYLLPVIGWCFPGLSEAERQLAHGVIRKTAHMIEYAILSVLWFRALRRGAWSFAAAQLLAVAAAGVYACSDEWHQTFVMNRTGALSDVAIDVAGASFAQAALRGWSWITGRPPPIGA